MVKKIMICAIEASGDMHAAALVREIKKIVPQTEMFGVGSELLAAENVELIADLTKRSTVGLIEPLKHLVGYIKILNKLKKIMRERKPDVLICVDGQGFNVPLATAAKNMGIKVVYYIAPQEWLWGTLEGGKKVAAVCDLILAIFPEEAAFYQKLGVKTIFNGHPLVNIVQAELTKEEFIKKYDGDINKPVLSFFPGSRAQELENILPVMLKVSRKFSDKYNCVFVGANNYCYTKILEASIGHDDIMVILKDNYNAMKAADFMMTSTGTTTLEAALLEVPMLAVYKMGDFSYWLVIKLYGARLPKYKALPNMLSAKEIIPEIIQAGFTVDNCVQKIQESLAPERYAVIKKELHSLRSALEKENILVNNAKAIVTLMTGETSLA